MTLLVTHCCLSYTIIYINTVQVLKRALNEWCVFSVNYSNTLDIKGGSSELQAALQH